MVAGVSGARSEDVLERARAAYARRAWVDAFSLFSEADRKMALSAHDLDLLAWSAALSANDQIALATLERLYKLHADTGECENAAYYAFWLGFRLFSLGEKGRAMGWLQRSQHLIEELGRESVVHGYLLLPMAHKSRLEGNFAGAADYSARAVKIGDDFGDPDLAAFARQLQGTALVHGGRVDEGVALLDESMLAVSSGETGPVIAGLVYCSVIATCCHVFAMDRAREWTNALADWCAAQPQLGPFNGSCMVHRSEIMQMNGAWPEALQEVEHAFRHLDDAVDRDTKAAAHYQQGEILRLRGEYSSAEKCYREANALGREPYPGLALLRLAEGRLEQAEAAIRRVTMASKAPLGRVKFLPAFVEIMLAGGHIDDAKEAGMELERISKEYGTEILDAIASHAKGRVASALGDAQAALPLLRRAFSIWQNVGAPYIAACIRAQIASACLELGDRDGAQMELDAARAVFEEIGAVPDLSAAESLRSPESKRSGNRGLTDREVEVLGLLAAGSTNRAIAKQLGLSTKTVDRHVGNIFNKLGVSSRAAATARAYRDKIL